MIYPSQTIARAMDARIKLRHYRLLLALDRHRSVTRVAEILGTSQPTVTRALADIEGIFKTALFVRTGRGLEPTVAGEVVIARAAYAIAESEALLHELEGVQTGRQGRLRLGVIPYASTLVLERAWAHLFSLQPKLAIVSTEDVTGNLLAALHARTLDCAICRFSQNVPGGSELEQVLLYAQQPRLVVAKPSAERLVRLPDIDVTQLAAMDWIFPPSDTPIRAMIDAIFSAAGRTVPVPVLETYAVRSIASAMRRLPRGITVLPEDIAHAVCVGSGAEVMPQAHPWSLPPVGLVWLRGSPKTALIEGLQQALLSPT